MQSETFTTTLDAVPQSAVRNMVAACRDAGVSAAQLEIFVKAGYVPQPKQAEFHGWARRLDDIDIDSSVPLSLGFGGARGPGKTHALIEQLCDDATRRDGLRILLLRRTGAALEDTTASMAQLFHGWGGRMIKSHIKFPNGSYIKLGHYRNASDVDRHLGQSWDVVAIEESTTLPEARHRVIDSTLRSTRKDWRARKYETTNPGGVSHHRYKRLFVDRIYRSGEDGRGFIHIQSTVDDNRILMKNDPAYVQILERFVGWEYRAYRLGDWNIAAGAFFTNFDKRVHVIRPMVIKPGWSRWVSLDHGWTHPTVVLFHAMDDEGVRYTTHEIWARKTIVPEIAAQIKGAGYAPQRHGSVYAGHDCFREDRNISHEYAANGVRLTRAFTSREAGWSEMASLLGDLERDDPIPPRWYIFEGCRHLIEELGRMQHNPSKPGDVLKVDADPETGDGGDDAADAARYGMMAVAKTRKPAQTRSNNGRSDTGTIMPGLH